MSASNTEIETETGSPDQHPECEFDADGLDISDFLREKYNLEKWECSRPVWEEASGNLRVWHTSDGQIEEKPPAELEKAVGDGNLHGSAAAGGNLSGIDFPVEMGFIDADLSRADLPEADLLDADLSGVNLRYADLSWADLRYADLSGTELIGADLWGVSF
jgi:hypothetical protein